MRKLLLPIKPKYVDAIIAGTKTVEYRTRIRKDTNVTTVLIYRSGDLKKVVAQFTIGGIIEGTPQQVWEQTKNIGGIEERDYFSYFANKDRAYAYQICNLMVYHKPIPLCSLGVDKAPMSFMYIEIK